MFSKPPPLLKGQAQFPHLASFMGGYFHQDFDINGNTLEAVVATSRAEGDLDFVAPLVSDIDAFLRTGDDGMAERFEEFFRPDIIATAFRPTIRAFLEALRDALTAT